MDSGYSKDSYSLTVGLALMLFFVETTYAAPHLTIEQPRFDFGSITNQSLLVHDFVIRNDGDVELEILRVNSGCDSCIQAQLKKSRIAPGEQTVVHSQLDLRLLAGRLSRSIILESNDPANPRLELTLEGEVVPLYQVIPPAISIANFPDQHTATVEITLLGDLRKPLTIASCDNTNITSTITAITSNQFRLTIQALDSLPRGRTTLTVTLRGADSNDPPCLILGSINYPADLEILPAQLLFAANDEPQLRILWVKQRNRTPLTLLDVLSPSDRIRCEIDPDPVSANYRIYVTADQLGKSAGQTQELTIKMIDESRKEKLIPVSITVGETSRVSQ